MFTPEELATIHDLAMMESIQLLRMSKDPDMRDAAIQQAEVLDSIIEKIVVLNEDPRAARG